MPGVSSVQITFREDADRLEAMPPGGFRLAIVNCWDLEVGFAARERLRACFASATKTARGARKRRPVASADLSREVLAVDDENRVGQPPAVEANLMHAPAD